MQPSSPLLISTRLPRSCVAVAKGSCRQTREEEPEVDPPCDRRWRERRQHDPGCSRRCRHLWSRGGSPSLSQCFQLSLTVVARVCKLHVRQTWLSRSSGTSRSCCLYTGRGATLVYPSCYCVSGSSQLFVASSISNPTSSRLFLQEHRVVHDSVLGM